MKEWWQSFFVPITGEIMFSSKTDTSGSEVDQILQMSHPKKGGKLLDLACGSGRHSILFSKKGFLTTGLDYSKFYLNDARKASKKERQRIDFIQGDMRNIKSHFKPNTFDLVVSLYNSFGYFKKRSADSQMLREVYRVLKPGGKFIINTLNAGSVKAKLKSSISSGREPIKNVFMIDAARFEPDQKKILCEWVIIDTRMTKTKLFRGKFEQNVYTHTELKALLKATGFKVKIVWGLLPGGKFEPHKTWHQTILVEKPVRSL
jgi:SAM-dependent methyltransferase